MRAMTGSLVLGCWLGVMATSAWAEEAATTAAQGARYRQALVGEIEVSLLDPQPDEKRVEDRQTLSARLPTVVREALSKQGLQLVDTVPANAEGVALIRISVKYDPGNRALRWVGGMFGAGKGTVEVHADALDARTGQVVASEDKSESKSMGAAGGDFYEMAAEAVADATEELVERLGETR